MSDAMEEVLKENVFIFIVEFGENGLQVGYFNKDEQGENTAQTHTIQINLEDDFQRDAYVALQNILRPLLDDAIRRLPRFNEEY